MQVRQGIWFYEIHMYLLYIVAGARLYHTWYTEYDKNLHSLTTTMDIPSLSQTFIDMHVKTYSEFASNS